MPDIDLGDLTEPGASTRLRGYLATPDDDGPWPGVVLIHEAFGVDDAMRAHADRLASLGYATLAVDLYSDGGPVRCLISTFRALLAGHGRPFADIAVARRFLLERTASTGKVGVIGFCMGGRFALLEAGGGAYDAASVNYGLLPPHLDDVLATSCPLVASYGGKDRGLRGGAAKVEAALDAAGVPHDVKEYPNAGHSFLNEHPNGPWPVRQVLRVTGTGPEPQSAAHAWDRIAAFFATHLR
ncbi:carboxymethylenebutenolidase [Mumia flava]|uniref:Carboxymethylenebutenolidase n=1 Tax=Mumia flava TaxID=1348852 RepID=A0A0B2BVF5_9ACTN|nr:dienelactone hydrolase family protein [Mumia flava]PJJ58190.1 carboxymethylenebutenolidase [Mumia flava]